MFQYWKVTGNTIHKSKLLLQEQDAPPKMEELQHSRKHAVPRNEKTFSGADCEAGRAGKPKVSSPDR